MEAASLDLHGARLRAEPRPAALGARVDRHQLPDLVADVLRVGLLVAPAEVGDHPLERAPEGVLAPAALPLEGVLLRARAVEEDLAHAGRQLPEGRLHVEAMRPLQRLHEDRQPGGRPPSRRDDGPVLEREIRVGDDPPGVELRPRAEAVATGAGAVGGVEGEGPRGHLGDAGAAVDAGELLREGDLLTTREGGEREAARLPERRLEGVDEASPDVGGDAQPVHDDLDRVRALPVDLAGLGELDRLSVDAGADEPPARQILQHLPELPLPAAHDRGEDLEARSLARREDPVGHLLDGLGGDRPAALVAVRRPRPREEDAEVVVDLGDGPDRRARVVRGRALLDRDCRREPLDVLDLGLLHLLEELPRVRREALDVAALPLRVDRVEREGRFAGAADAGDDGQAVARDLEVDVLQVVLRSTLDDDAVLHGVRSRVGSNANEPSTACAVRRR